MGTIKRILVGLAVLLAAVWLAGCLPRLPQPPAREAVIEVFCAGCISGQAGPAPLHIVLYAKAPDNADYAWTIKRKNHEDRLFGRFVSRVLDSPGEYEVKLSAMTAGPRRAMYEAYTFFRVLEPMEAAHQVIRREGELFNVAVIAPREVALGQRFVVSIVVSANRMLDYVEWQGSISRELFSDADLYGQVLRLPAGKTVYEKFFVDSLVTGVGHMSLRIQGAAGPYGLKEELNIYIHVFEP